MKIAYIFRKPRKEGNFSIENVFTEIIANLPNDVLSKKIVAFCVSNGFFNRLLIGFQVFFAKGAINHITGDIHFAALFLPRRRTLITVHDIGFYFNKKGLVKKILYLFWIKLPLEWCAKITTISEATKMELVSLIPSVSEKITIIPNPIPNHFAYFPKTFNSEIPSILQIGTKYNKNVYRLIQALEGIPCRLEIVGQIDSDLENELLRAKIHFNNAFNLDRESLIRKYREADIVTFVSTHEGFGLPIVEANSIGRVVLTSNVSSMPEIGGNAAYYVDPYSVSSIRTGLLELINNEKIRNHLILNGLENIKRFDSKFIAEKYAVLYRQMLSDL